ncbi:extracellular solute-binding protein [Aureimonas fodinaquatilis]|uniref:Extracellular solute-binding protein n=2 Tax=Aureimonas fodinaquatilis TaxID=2565783 RepID=A0A5B0E3D6_9HYPH|nr:extracellular solute-binding protein [Aureimonas fodinaquatilis]
MVATSRKWHELTGIAIEWEQRSLQDFESYPVEDLARNYDLIVIDHPHVGQIAAENCLAPLDTPERRADLATLASQSVGQSFPSYNWQGRQWALPIDAASQVQAYRVDALTGPAVQWSDVIELARQGKVTLPMRAPHALMTFYTLAANLGTPCSSEQGPELIGREAGINVLSLMIELLGLMQPDCWDMDPIAALELIAAGERSEVLLPLTYGYLSYATEGFRAHPVSFADIAAAGGNGPLGAALGGTGIAVSAYSRNVNAAIDYAFWVAGAEIQKTLYAEAGGQPGNLDAWEDKAVNEPVNGFYRDTLETLRRSWMRPRFDGYMKFQDEGSQILQHGLQEGTSPETIVDRLNAAYEKVSQSASQA